MSDVFDKEAIVDFVKSDENNLQLSLAVLSVGNEIKEYIIQDFLQSLQVELNKNINADWVCTIDSNPIKQTHTLLQLKHKHWKNSSIALAPDKGVVSDLWYGVLSEDGCGTSEEGLKLHQFITSTLTKVPSIPANSWWPFSSRVNEKYRHWDALETLLYLKKDNVHALNYFSESLSELVAVVDSYLHQSLLANQ